MSEIQIRVIDGWPLGTMGGAAEPRIRDLDLAEKLGYDRPRKIRDLITRLVKAGKLNDVSMRPAVERIAKTGAVGGIEEREVNEYWLTEAQALKVSARSETDVADALLDQMIAVFTAFTRGLLPPGDYTHVVDRLEAPVARAVRAIDAAAANPERFQGNGQIGDHPMMTAQVRRAIGHLAEVRDWSWQKSHGLVRKLYAVVSYRRIGQHLIWHVLRHLAHEATMRLLPAPERQLGLFGGGSDDETEH